MCTFCVAFLARCTLQFYSLTDHSLCVSLASSSSPLPTPSIPAACFDRPLLPRETYHWIRISFVFVSRPRARPRQSPCASGLRFLVVFRLLVFFRLFVSRFDGFPLCVCDGARCHRLRCGAVRAPSRFVRVHRVPCACVSVLVLLFMTRRTAPSVRNGAAESAAGAVLPRHRSRGVFVATRVRSLCSVSPLNHSTYHDGWP